MICSYCHHNVESNKFCNYCGKPLEVPVVSSLNNKGSWVIAPGEIVRHISESDFANITHLSGIIIQPGVSALIYSDGREIAHITSGQYDFVSEADIDDIANTRINDWGSVRGAGVNIWRAFTRVMLGRKVGDTEQEFNRTLHSRQEIIKHLNSTSNISLYLKVDRPFPVLLGYDPNKSEHGCVSPIKVRTKLHDIDICVSLMLQIVDFRECVKYYMIGKQSLETKDIQAAVSPYVSRILQDVLRYEDIEEMDLTQELRNKITTRLLESDRYLFGVKILGVPEITCNNEDFNRFRTLAKEMYCSEKELDYLRRTNEFKNRLAAAEIEQKVGNARSDLDLKIALDEVNKDRLLHAEEMEIFAQTLKVRREDRNVDLLEALSNSSIRKMEILASVKKRELVLASQMDEFKADIAFEEYKREKAYEAEKIDIEAMIYGKEFVVKRRKLEDSFELDDLERKYKYRVKQEDIDADINADIAKTKGQHTIERLKDELERERQEDKFAFDWKVKNAEFEFNTREEETRYAFNRKQQQDSLNDAMVYQNMALNSLERMNQMSEASRDNEARRESIKRQEEQRHEQYLADLARQSKLDQLQADNQRAHIYSGMTSSQITAAALAAGIEKGNISNEAVESISHIFSSDNEAAAAQAILKAREQDFQRMDQERNQMMQNWRDDMKQMTGMAFDFSRDAMQALSAEKMLQDKNKEEARKLKEEMQDQRYDEIVALKEEYRHQMIHEQSRTDANQDKALDYTSRVNIGRPNKKK